MMPQVYSGAKATISINNEIVAAAFVADYTVETRATEIETIDSVFTAELAPERVHISMNLRVYRLPDNDPVIYGYAPGKPDLGEPAQWGFTQAKYLTVEIKDRNDLTILYLPKCWLVRRSGSMSVGEFMTETWSLVATHYMGPSF